MKTFKVLGFLAHFSGLKWAAKKKEISYAFFLVNESQTVKPIKLPSFQRRPECEQFSSSSDIAKRIGTSIESFTFSLSSLDIDKGK